MKKYLLIRIVLIIFLIAAATIFVLVQANAQNTYLVTFDAAGGSPEPQSQTVSGGELVTQPTTDPQISGYTFVGWYSGDYQYDFSRAVNSDLTLTAHYLEDLVTITFNSDGGTLIAPITVTNGTIITRPEDPVKENYTFVGWYYLDQLFDFNQPLTESVTILAVYIQGQFVVNFITNLNNTLESVAVNAGQTITLGDHSYEGYVVSDYYLDGEVFDLNTPIEQNITLTVNYISAVNSQQGLKNNLDNVSSGDQIVIIDSFEIDEEIYIFDNIVIMGSNHQITYTNALAVLSILEGTVEINNLTLYNASLTAIKVLSDATLTLNQVTFQNATSGSLYVENASAILNEVRIIGIGAALINVVGDNSHLTINTPFTYINGLAPVILVETSSDIAQQIIEAPMLYLYRIGAFGNIYETWFVGELLAELLQISN